MTAFASSGFRAWFTSKGKNHGSNRKRSFFPNISFQG